MQECKIFVVGHKEFQLPTDDPIYVPLMVGNQYGELPEGYLSDATGDNISAKNPRYNELTGLYWIWENVDAEIVGVCHYRRYFVRVTGKMLNLLSGMRPNNQFEKTWLLDSEYIEKILAKKDLIVHNKTFFVQGNRNQLCINVNDTKNDRKSKLPRELLDLAGDIFGQVYPDQIAIYEKVMNGKSAHLLNMMICRKKTLDCYCEWLFPLLFEIEKEINIRFPNQAFDRCMGLLAERLLDVWIVKEEVQIKECFSINTERVDWKAW